MRSKTLSTLVGSAALAVLTLAPPMARAQTPPVVRVSVTNVAAHQGFIMAALHDEAAWGDRALAVARVAVDGDVVAFSLQAPGPGRYAVRLFHDVDSDGALDANLFGVPTEPFGFSNNAPIQFGPPSFEAAAFEVAAAGAEQTIALR